MTEFPVVNQVPRGWLGRLSPNQGPGAKSSTHGDLGQTFSKRPSECVGSTVGGPSRAWLQGGERGGAPGGLNTVPTPGSDACRPRNPHPQTEPSCFRSPAPHSWVPEHKHRVAPLHGPAPALARASTLNPSRNLCPKCQRPQATDTESKAQGGGSHSNPGLQGVRPRPRLCGLAVRTHRRKQRRWQRKQSCTEGLPGVSHVCTLHVHTLHTFVCTVTCVYTRVLAHLLHESKNPYLCTYVVSVHVCVRVCTPVNLCVHTYVQSVRAPV